MNAYDFNPYFWNITSSQVTSTVVSYTLMSNTGIKLHINKSLKPIIIFIPRNKASIAWQHSRIFTQSKNGATINYHRIQVQNQSSLHIELLPTNYCVSFAVYFKYGRPPTIETYDLKKAIPDFSQCNVSEARIRADSCVFYKKFISNVDNDDNSVADCNRRKELDREIKQKIMSSCSVDPFRIFIPENYIRKGHYYVGKCHFMKLLLTA